MSLRLQMMWVVRDHGVEGKAQPGRVVAVSESESEARAIADMEWAPSVRQALVVFDPVMDLARFVGDPIKVTR